MRVAGFNVQQYGDLFMATVAARYLKVAHPDAHLTFSIAGDFRECAPLFLDHPHIDHVHILHRARDGFDVEDWQWLQGQRIDHVFNPMADHDHAHPWWAERHQCHEAAHMHGIPIPPGDNGKIHLTRWFKPSSGFSRFIAFSPWPAFHEGVNNPKAIPPNRAQEIVNWLKQYYGYNVLQVGGPNEPQLDGTLKPDTDYFTSIRNVLGCRAMIMGDSGMNWALSGYDFPVFALYGHRYYRPEHVKNIQPINPNGMYIDAPTVAEITTDQIIDGLKTFLGD